MNIYNDSKNNRGFSFVEVLVTAAIMALVFGGLFSSFSVMIKTIGNSKAKAGATALEIQRVEYIRSLPYSEVGTDGGVPAGPIPQNSTTTLNGITYTERVLIEYVDDEADGFGGADSNGILADYKRVKVEYSWVDNDGNIDSTALVSNIVPVGIETTDGGGTIRVNVFDSAAVPVDSAEVHFYNNSGTTTIDTTRFTDANGLAYLAGAPAIACYEISVTKSGFSTDGTYVASSSNPNPITPPVAVVESAVSTMNFQIDEVSDLLIKTVGMPTYDSFLDSFTDDSLVSNYTNTIRAADAVELTSTLGVYDASGTVTSATTTPSVIDRWYSFSWSATNTPNTSVRVSLYYDTGSGLALVSDTDLPGNSAGFVNSPIDIQSLDTTTYATLALVGTLETTDTSETPLLEDWSIIHIESEPVVSSIPVTVVGDKTIGTDASLQPVYKYNFSGSTDGSGELALTDLEFDIYSINVNTASYDIYDICPTIPHILPAGVSDTVTFTLGPNASDFLRVSVKESGGSNLANATVRLENAGVDQTTTTNLCGQTYFSSGLYTANDYTLTVSAPGYTTEVITDVSVTSSSSESVILNP